MYVQNTPNTISGTRALPKLVGLGSCGSRSQTWNNFFEKYEIEDIRDKYDDNAFTAEYKLWKGCWVMTGVLTKWKNFKTDRNWRSEALFPSEFEIQIFKGGKFIMNTSYSQGVGHHIAPKQISPSGMVLGHYSQVTIPYGRATYDQRIRLENSVPSTPTMANVLYSLLTDAQTTEGYSFSEWCYSFGYSDDSIQAQKIYLACGETAGKIRPYMSELAEILENF